MKKILFKIAIIALISNSTTANAQAQTIKAESMEDFTTAAPAITFSVKITETCNLPDGTILEEGAIVSGLVTKIKHAKRLKRDGYFEFIPNEITTNGQSKKIELPKTYAKVIDCEPLNTKQLAGNAAKFAAGMMLKGASQGISFVQGVSQAEDGERLKSGLTKVYKDSPLSYVEEGSELNIQSGDTVILIIKKLKNED